MTERAVLPVEPFIIPGNGSMSRKKRIGLVIVRHDGKYYQATLMFNKRRSEPVKGIVGQQILATEPDALREMLLEIGRVYPPKKDLKVYPHDTRVPLVYEPWNKKQ